MPYSSPKQERLMRAVAHSPGFAKKVGIPQAVGQKFASHKAEGGALKESGMKKESPAMVKKEMAFMKKKGAPKSMIKHEMAEAKGKTKKMSSGGFTRAADGVAAHGRTKATQVKMMGGGKC